MMYCVKCRAKREGKDTQEVPMVNGKKATKAICEVCGTTMFNVGKAVVRVSKKDDSKTSPDYFFKEHIVRRIDKALEKNLFKKGELLKDFLEDNDWIFTWQLRRKDK